MKPVAVNTGLVVPRPILRLTDARTRKTVSIHRGQGSVRIAARGPARGHPATPADLRVLITTDLLHRVLKDLHAMHAPVALLRPLAAPPSSAGTKREPPSGPADSLEQDLDALWIRPPAATAHSAQRLWVLLGGPAHIVVAGEHQAREHAELLPSAALRHVDLPSRAPVPAVNPTQEAVPASAMSGTSSSRAAATNGVALLRVAQVVTSAAVARPWREPLAMRLALLWRQHTQPALLDAAALRRAQETLTRWRHLVSQWAHYPSAPIPRDVMVRAQAAFEDNLNTPAALGILQDLEASTTVSAGAKFEVFLHLDRVFGLDLGRDLARSASHPRSH
jgi:hypothetical protein